MPRRPPKPDIVQLKFAASVRRLGLGNRSILLAVSGGGDSIVLLDIAAQEQAASGFQLGVACVDHGLRKASKKELALVGQAAKRRGVPFHPLQAPISKGAGIEARAREARYQALESARREHGYELIATAHTATDQAETLLMRLSRGSALAGAAGIHERRGEIVRPLLSCTREEVRAYLRKRRLRFAEDAMNRDPAFLRTRIRRNVLPALEKAAGPGVDGRLASFARLASEDEALLAEWAASALRRIRLPGGLDAVAVRALPRAIRRRVLGLLLEEAGLPVDLELIDACDSAVVSGRSATLPMRRVLRNEGDWLRITEPDSASPARFAVALTADEEPVAVPEAGLELAWRTSVPPVGEGWRAQPIALPVSPGVTLSVRSREPGDRLDQAGGRRRKLQDVLTDARVPRELRDRTPIVTAPDGRILCVVGVWPPWRGDLSRAGSFVLHRALES